MVDSCDRSGGLGKMPEARCGLMGKGAKRFPGLNAISDVQQPFRRVFRDDVFQLPDQLIPQARPTLVH
jgi:hypothetical protein